jgi:hypothetical protein
MDANEHNRSAAGRPLRPTEVSQEQLAEIVGLLKGLRYGSVHIIVQDGVIVQIDRTEKKRIVRNHSSAAQPRES